MQGWIKLHRKILNSDMYVQLTSKQRDVLIQCLLLANHEEKEWEWGGKIYKCKAGQFITSLEKLSIRCSKDVTMSVLRTSLKKLEMWGFLTNESTKTGRLVTICKWETYQSKDIESNKDDDKQMTNDRQTIDKQMTTNKNDKELIKNNKENKIYRFKKPTVEIINEFV